MMDATFGRLSQCRSHVQRSDRQIPLHVVVHSPTDDGQVKPILTGPDKAYVAVKELGGVCFRHQRRLRNRPARL